MGVEYTPIGLELHRYTSRLVVNFRHHCLDGLKTIVGLGFMGGLPLLWWCRYTQGANAVVERAASLAHTMQNANIQPLHLALSIFDEAQEKAGGLGQDVAKQAGTSSRVLRDTIKKVIAREVPTQSPPPPTVEPSRELQVIYHLYSETVLGGCWEGGREE